MSKFANAKISSCEFILVWITMNEKKSNSIMIKELSNDQKVVQTVFSWRSLSTFKAGLDFDIVLENMF
jgi:hypothetical protein